MALAAPVNENKKKDIKTYLQNYLYNAAVMLSMNHRTFAAKSNRFASILIAPACNSLLKIETVSVAAITQLLIESRINLVAVQILADSFFSIVGGIPFLVFSVALGAYTLKRADKSDESGIKVLNDNIRSQVGSYLYLRKKELEATIRFVCESNGEKEDDKDRKAKKHFQNIQSENVYKHLLVKVELKDEEENVVRHKFVDSLQEREPGFVPYGAPVISRIILTKELDEVNKLAPSDEDEIYGMGG